MVIFRSKKKISALVFFIMMSYLVCISGAFAGQPAKDEKPAQYNLDFSFQDNLKMFTGEYVRITLNSGQQMSGILKDVKNGLLHLEKLTGRDYFDALIQVKDISAMDAKFRGPKR